MGTPSPKYTAEFKQKAVELYRKSGTTYAEVARGLGCDPRSLSDWLRKASSSRSVLVAPWTVFLTGPSDRPSRPARQPMRSHRTCLHVSFDAYLVLDRFKHYRWHGAAFVFTRMYPAFNLRKKFYATLDSLLERRRAWYKVHGGRIGYLQVPGAYPPALLLYRGCIRRRT